MVIETYNPEQQVRECADLIYTVSEAIWKQLADHEDKSWYPSKLSRYRTMSRAIFVASTAVHDLTTEVEELDREEVHDAVVVFYVVAEKVWTYFEKEWGRFPGSMSNARSLKHVAESALAVVESWVKGRKATKVATTLPELDRVHGKKGD